MVVFLLTSCVNNQLDNKTNDNEIILETDTQINNDVNVDIKSVSDMAKEIKNKTIDPNIYLDYKKGIEEKVYKWIKSDDDKYYTLAFIDENGVELTLTGLRSGTYYEAILKNLSDALNKFVLNGEIDVESAYGDYSSWLIKDEDGSYIVTDLKGFMIGTGLVNNRNKAIPGFDAKDKSAENNAFGRDNEDTVHFSKSISKILKDNYEELSKLDGFDKNVVDEYIDNTLTGKNADYINNQTALLNATHILLGIDGFKSVNPVKHFRNRSGTADQHTSFGIGYNIMLAAKMQGIDTDYSLVWNMQHGNNEGNSTGTFIEWVNNISK